MQGPAPLKTVAQSNPEQPNLFPVDKIDGAGDEPFCAMLPRDHMRNADAVKRFLVMVIRVFEADSAIKFPAGKKGSQC